MAAPIRSVAARVSCRQHAQQLDLVPDLSGPVELLLDLAGHGVVQFPA